MQITFELDEPHSQFLLELRQQSGEPDKLIFQEALLDLYAVKIGKERLSLGRHEEARREARQWLLDRLGAGPRGAKELQAEVEAGDLGFKWRTCQAAKRDLGIVSEQRKGEWLMSLPRARSLLL